MNSLKVPEGGLLLEGSSENEPALPPQAFALTLPGSVVQDIINGAKSPGGIQLSLGDKPTLHFGSKSHRVAPPIDGAPHDLYLTRPFESTRKAQKLPQVSSLFSKYKAPPSLQKKRPVVRGEHGASSKTANKAASSKSSASPPLDAGLEALQNGLAAHDSARDRAIVVDKMPTSGNISSKAKSKLLSSHTGTPRSLPASPALNAVNSPSMTPGLSASDQAMGRAKLQRFNLVHQLAVKDQTKDHLREKYSGKLDTFDSTLDKVAVLDPETKKWAMRRVYWKELDVWNYPYDTQEDREMAIGNAIRQFDKQRLSSGEPEWQKLLPKEERGKGKCLSRLQANLAKLAQPAPAIKVQKTEDSSGSRDDADSLDSDRAKNGGESMSRSSSNQQSSKPKKPTAQEAQAKRLLSNSKSKPTTQKPSPTKPKAVASKVNGGRVLSQAIIENSDSSGDEAPVARAKPVTKPAPKPADKPAPKPAPKAIAKPAPRPRDTVVVNTTSAARESIKQQPVKRPREDDSDSSSSSGTPLSKRIKQKQPLPAARSKYRASDANHKSQGNGTSSSSFKNKNTSPTKSSPLASSPPTNASEFENDGPPILKKRKAEGEGKPQVAKRRAMGYVSTEIVSQANEFKATYNKYLALHERLLKLEEPPREKVDYLKRLRGRLVDMKADIYQQCPPTRA